MYQHCKQCLLQVNSRAEIWPLALAVHEQHKAAEQPAFEFCLQSAGVQVNLFQHTLEHGTPDAVFPNNWFSTHPASETGQDSAMVLYPMKTKNRHVQILRLLLATLCRLVLDAFIKSQHGICASAMDCFEPVCSLFLLYSSLIALDQQSIACAYAELQKGEMT